MSETGECQEQIGSDQAILYWVQSRYNPLAQAYLRKKKAEGKTPKHAFRCLKRRMVDIVHAVWKGGQTHQQACWMQQNR